MTPGASKIAARDLGTLFRLGTIGGLTDAQLLDRFLAQPGEEAEVAFAAVVERHGPMVLRVCRRILSDPHDAEDAFQVTFLVLARKARSIARRGLLANWLHGVAVRTAKEVRKNAARRRHREEKMKARLRVDMPADDRDDELRAALDEELSRLPESFRAAVVLCDLEGKSHREAARLIGVPVGTVSSRLVRARSLLRDRLTRRGLDPTAADPSRDSAPMTVPPALLAATSRAAARVAIEGTLAGAVPAHLATIAQGVLKTMVLARLTAKGVILATILSLATGAAAVGVVSRVLLGAGPEPFAAARSSDREWAWVDNLQNADDATKERLKRCAGAATTNFASLHRLIFDYDLKTEHGRVAKSGETTIDERVFSRGTVYWKEGTVRYDFFPLGKLDPEGRKSIYKRPRVYSVVRSRDMLAYTEQNPVYGLWLTVVKPPQSAEEWEYQSPAPQRRLDPWLHYAKPFCTNRSKLREYWETCRAIESEEAEGRVLLRFIFAEDRGRLEVTCDRAADWLPVRHRSGPIGDGKWNVIVDQTNEWQKLSGVWYPVHQVKMVNFGGDHRPVKELDLTVRNLKANGAANLPDSAFTLSAMTIPDGTPGLDRRQEPFRGLSRANGVVRESRPGEGPSPRNVQEGEIERQKDEETVPAGESGGPETLAPPSGSTGAAKAVVPNHEYLALLEEYEPAHRALEKASLEAKGEQRQRETYLALARLDWKYAPRFLEIARKNPKDPVAIDALGWLVTNDFNPPESQQAADILIRDHLASERMIPIYRRLAITLNPAPSSAAERLLRAAAEKAPTADARGLACLRLADLLKYRAEAIRTMRGPEPEPFFKLMELARSGGRQPIEQTDEDHPDALTREAVQFYDRVVQQYPDFEGKRGRLAERAAQSLFLLRDLAVGKPAPEVDGPDVDGKPLKLSDHRGKVVVLTFSVDLPGPCREAYPHYRALIERMKGRPFAILSVNLDDNKQTLKNCDRFGRDHLAMLVGGRRQAANSDRWHVGFIPSVYVIDADGIIRAKDVKGKALDEAVDALVGKTH